MKQRVTLKWLAEQLREKLQEAQIKDIESVSCARSYNRSCDIEAGACILIYLVHFKKGIMPLHIYGFYTCKQHEKELSKGHALKLKPTRGGYLQDSEFGF